MNSQTICVLDEPERRTERVRRRRLRSRKAIKDALTSAGRKQVWVLQSDRTIADLLRVMSQVTPNVSSAKLICYVRTERACVQMIESGFVRALIGTAAMVPFDDLVEILGTHHPEDYCVGADWDQQTELLAIWRGDLSAVVVPMGEFAPRGGVSPDPERLSIEDCGQTVRMGEYEASLDALLYQRDPDYRRRAKKRLVQEEQGLGASIRRLRVERGVARRGFAGLDEKTLARIERGEVQRPQHKTLATIAQRLGVSVEELGEY